MAPTSSPRKPVLAVVSPFLDTRHGTERLVQEWISRLTNDFDVHIYSQRVEDMDLARLTWHRVPEFPGPHIFNFVWWLCANHTWRWWDRTFRGIRHDLVFTPGTNCFDADAISVHIVFAEFFRQVRPELTFARNPVRSWPRLIHRRIYYRLIIWQERRLYRRPRAQLILIARKTADDLDRFYGAHDTLPIVYMGLNHDIFNPEKRIGRREAARKEFGVAEDQVVFLLVGNDWRKKGLFTILEALASLADLPVVLLVAGNDETGPYDAPIARLELSGRVRFLPVRSDVAFYYSAADVYVGPSLEDTFAVPPLEAMACGLPVITTPTNGTSEIMTDGVDGLILGDADDAQTLGTQMRALAENPQLRERIGAHATETASKFTWDDNARQFREIFNALLAKKAKASS